MSLNERKIKILQAIINDYIATAEPVGSRTIAKKYNLGISSATIRNEMSDLEEMGFILQPHASAGRIPSDLGYRLYVDRLMQHKTLSENDQIFLHEIVKRNIGHIDYLMEETAKALSLLTNYTTIISEPVTKDTRLKQVRLIPLDETNIMLITATEEHFVKNHIIKVSRPLEDDIIFSLSNKINHLLQGASIHDLTKETMEYMKKELGEYQSLVSPIFKAVSAAMEAAENVQVHLSGTKNILAFPEFSDVEKAKSLFQTLEEKDVLITLLGENTGDDLQIVIGNENGIQQMKDCSVITANYKLSDNQQGSIGVLGPTRMNYSQVISVLDSMVKNIESVLNALTKGNTDS